MALFSKKQRGVALAPIQAGPSPLDLLGGNYFLERLAAGQIPPPGYSYLNRFLHGPGAEWQEEFATQRAAMADTDALRESMTKLAAALDFAEVNRGSVMVLQALEEAVTLNLTGLVVAIADHLLRIHPDLRAEEALTGGTLFGWSTDGPTDQLAVAIREEVSALDAALSTSVWTWAKRPGESFRCCVATLGALSNRIESAPSMVGTIAKYGGSMDASTQRGVRRMILAVDATKQYQRAS